MAPNELILEVREFLSENVCTCFFTNYSLEHNGKKLSDYDDVSQLDFTADNNVQCSLLPWSKLAGYRYNKGALSIKAPLHSEFVY